ncbi:MAG: 23S rRNA (guanosine(2251)-2'-O)-methyltransferase RlmB [Desulfobulbaceae bacterium A2]|nr:MAG: 23S rRNA (guanosine(2251)-2'-O)-methyltransferase RlmB [Desulfobulbaceae bacterium A2]
MWGLHPVFEALQRSDGLVSEVLVQDGRGGPRVQEIVELARQARVRLRFVPRLPLTEAGQVHQGVLARISPVPLLGLDELLVRLPPTTAAPRLLAVDSVQDPRNLGAMLRAALASGMHGAILTRERCAPVGGTVVKASAGAALSLPLCRVVNLADTLSRLKDQGYWIFGAVSDPAAMSLYSTNLDGPLCLVVGNEGSGLRPLVARRCDHLVTIPMAAGFESLNSSMAAGVIMFEIARRRAEAEGDSRPPAG